MADGQYRIVKAHFPSSVDLPASLSARFCSDPGGGVKLLKADPDTPVESILNDNAIQANPFLLGRTVRWVIAWANKMPDAAPQPKQWGAGAQERCRANPGLRTQRRKSAEHDDGRKASDPPGEREALVPGGIREMKATSLGQASGIASGNAHRSWVIQIQDATNCQ